MAKVIHNLLASAKTLGGMSIAANSSYTISDSELLGFQNDTKVHAGLSADPATVAIEESDFPGQITGVDGIKLLLNKKMMDEKGRDIVATTIFGVNEFRFRGKGVSKTITAGETQELDYTIPEKLYMNGGRIILEGHSKNDTITFQVAHPQAGVLDEYISTWQVATDVQEQESIILPYIAALPTGLILRVKYNSTGTEDVLMKINYHLQKDF